MIDHSDLERIVNTDHYDPFQVLGSHRIDVDGKPSIVVRAFMPDTAEAFVVEAGVKKQQETAMKKIHDGGVFEAVFEGREEVFPYRLKRVDMGGSSETFEDSYSFLPTLSDFDLHLFGAGDHHRLYERLGAHYLEVGGVGGIRFAVWAPNAQSVSVVGDFNGWDRRKHAMRVLGQSGIWELFVPGLPEGELYKFQIKTKNGELLDKTDPFATSMETRPRTASKVNVLQGYRWNDGQWMKRRVGRNAAREPVSVYEVHLGSWKRVPEEGNRWFTYREAADDLVQYVTERGFNYIELLPVLEHPLDASWGYQVTGYFAPTSRHGSPQDFMYFVDQCHRHGIGVILDWVPAHFPKDPHALAKFDGTHLFEHEDPRKGEHQDWGTSIFNYSRNEVRNFLLSSALFWLDKYHIDGIRIDAVASMLYLDYSRKEGEWVSNQFGGRENLEAIDFLKHLNRVVHESFPGVLMFAEESTAWPGVTASVEGGGLGFDLKWNMGWMHDILLYLSKDPVHRSHHQGMLTFSLLYAFSERFLLPLSHDEVVHGKASLLGKMPGDDWQKFANLRALFALMYGSPGKKLLFMGSEFGQWNEWNHDQSLDWHLLEFDRHRGIQRWIDDLNSMYRMRRPLHEVDFDFRGFEWIDFRDAGGSIISFERKSDDEAERILAVFNFTPVPRTNYRIGVRTGGIYQEILNSDSRYYGGTNVGNFGSIQADATPAHGRPFSLNLTLPPLGAIFLVESGERTSG